MNQQELILRTLEVFVKERDLQKHDSDIWVPLTMEAYSFLELLEDI